MNLRFVGAFALGLMFLLAYCIYSPVSAETPQSSSANYGVNEVYFGSGGDLNDCSTSYCAKVSLGETGVGNPTSANYQLRAGFNTTDVPTLEFYVSGGTVDLGTLTTSTTGYGSVTFSVLDYVSSGYNVILTGTPPSETIPSGTYSLTAMNPATTSSTGNEQFGINLVANGTPSVGAAVQQVPDSTFGFGTASSGYNTANQFKFNDGDTVASSSEASGESLFTLSMIANIANSTPGGSYSGTIGLVAVATF